MKHWDMIPEVCAYGTAADYCRLPDADQRCHGVAPLDSLPAQWWNAMWHDNNYAFNCSRDFVNNIGQELCNVITCRGGTLNANCNTQLYDTIFAIGNAYRVGMVKNWANGGAGSVCINTDGTMSVAGWGTVTGLSSAVNTLQSDYRTLCLTVQSLGETVGCHTIDIATLTGYQTCLACDLASVSGTVSTLNSCVGNAALTTTAQTLTEAVNELKNAIDNFQGVTYSDTDPTALGTTSPGTSDTAARGNHVHPISCCICTCTTSRRSYMCLDTTYGQAIIRALPTSPASTTYYPLLHVGLNQFFLGHSYGASSDAIPTGAIRGILGCQESLTIRSPTVCLTGNCCLNMEAQCLKICCCSATTKTNALCMQMHLQCTLTPFTACGGISYCIAPPSETSCTVPFCIYNCTVSTDKNAGIYINSHSSCGCAINTMTASGCCGFNNLVACGTCGGNTLCTTGSDGLNVICATGANGLNCMVTEGCKGGNCIFTYGACADNRINSKCRDNYFTAHRNNYIESCTGYNGFSAGYCNSIWAGDPSSSVCRACNIVISRAFCALGDATNELKTCYLTRNPVSIIECSSDTGGFITTSLEGIGCSACINTNVGGATTNRARVATCLTSPDNQVLTCLYQSGRASGQNMVANATNACNLLFASSTGPTCTANAPISIIQAQAYCISCDYNPRVQLRTFGHSSDHASGLSQLTLCSKAICDTGTNDEDYGVGYLQYDGNAAFINVGRPYNCIVMDSRVLQIELDSYSSLYGSRACAYPPTLEIRHGIVDAIQGLTQVDLRYCCRSSSGGNYCQEIFYSNHTIGMVNCKGCGGCAECLAYFTPDYGLLRVYDDMCWHTTGRCISCSTPQVADSNTWGFFVYKR